MCCCSGQRGPRKDVPFVSRFCNSLPDADPLLAGRNITALGLLLYKLLLACFLLLKVICQKINEKEHSTDDRDP